MTLTFLLFFDIGGGEILLILTAAFLLLGPKKIPEIARTIGKGMYHLRKATDDITEEIEKSNNAIENQTEVKEGKKADVE